MIFKLFLKQEIEGKLPIAKVKEDFAYFKNIFKYAEKSGDLYNNLIDNIFWLLEAKFGSFEMLYTDNSVAYNELNLILATQIPQFLFIQKKQIAESLDIFADINNWGYTTKDLVKRQLIGDEVNLTSTNYIPIDNQNADPYSQDKNDKNKNSKEEAEVKRLANDFLSYFGRIKWDIASIDLTTILKPYYSLFILIDFNLVEDKSSSNLEEDVYQLKEQMKVVIEEIATNEENIATNTTNIATNTNSLVDAKNKIQTNKQDIATLNRELATTNNRFNQYYTSTQLDTKFNNIYTKPESDDKFGAKITVANNTQRITNIETGLRNGNIVNYVGEWNSSTTFNLAQATTFRDKWFVSKINNNINNQPDVQGSNQYWELLSSGPSVNLDDYYTKTESDSRFANINNVYTKSFIDSLKRDIYNDMYPVGSLVITSDGTTHPIVNRYPSSFTELSDSDIAYLAIGTNSSYSNSTSFTIQREQLPNLNFSHSHGYVVYDRQNAQPWNFGNGGNVWNGFTTRNLRSDREEIYLNGNVSQQSINLQIKPKTLKIRVWKVISNIM